MRERLRHGQARGDADREAAAGRVPVDIPLMIYGLITGSVAVGVGYLTMRLADAPGIVAVLVTVAIVAAAGLSADPVLRKLRTPADPT